MKVKVEPGRLAGEIKGISSKSLLHRVLFCAAFSDKPTTIGYVGLCEDVKATIGALRALGADIKVEPDVIYVTPITERGIRLTQPVCCGESGTTLRFFLPVAAAVTQSVCVTGNGRLPQRPIEELLKSLIVHGKQVDSRSLPLIMKGRITGGEYQVPGNVTSQYLSGLLLMSGILNDDITINYTGKLESKPYVDMTLRVMETFGVNVLKTETGFVIAGKNRFRSPDHLDVEGDWSNAAFFLVLNALGQEVRIPGLSTDSCQGDAAIVSVIRQMRNSRERVVDLSQIPDLVAPISVLAAATPGVTNLVHGERLRLKESDRLVSTSELIRSLGGNVAFVGDGLRIEGTDLLGGTVATFNDHRIAMAAGIAACVCKNPVVIEDADVVNKSYPHFYEELKQIGGNLTWMS